MSNPPISPPQPEPSSNASNLQCPHCGHALDLSWRRYWIAPTGKHVCSNCGQKSRLTLSAPLRVLTHIIGGLAPVPTAFLLPFLFDAFAGQTLVIWFVGYLMSALLADKFLESHYGVLRAVK